MRSNRKRNRREEAEPVKEPRPIARMLDLPPSALVGLPQIEIAGNQEAVIGGCQGILEYDENVIKLTAGRLILKFTGRNLQVRVLTHDSAIVAGTITGIEFLS